MYCTKPSTNTKKLAVTAVCGEAIKLGENANLNTELPKTCIQLDGKQTLYTLRQHKTTTDAVPPDDIPYQS